MAKAADTPTAGDTSSSRGGTPAECCEARTLHACMRRESPIALQQWALAKCVYTHIRHVALFQKGDGACVMLCVSYMHALAIHSNCVSTYASAPAFPCLQSCLASAAIHSTALGRLSTRKPKLLTPLRRTRRALRPSAAKPVRYMHAERESHCLVAVGARKVCV